MVLLSLLWLSNPHIFPQKYKETRKRIWNSRQLTVCLLESFQGRADVRSFF